MSEIRPDYPEEEFMKSIRLWDRCKCEKCQRYVEYLKKECKKRFPKTEETK
jgi:hypothetical protein